MNLEKINYDNPNEEKLHLIKECLKLIFGNSILGMNNMHAEILWLDWWQMTIWLTEKSLSDRSLCINKLGDKQNDFLDMSVTLEKRKEI